MHGNFECLTNQINYTKKWHFNEKWCEYICRPVSLLSQSSGTHLHIEQLVPLGYDEEADAVYGSRQLHVIDQQSQKNHVRKQSGEVNHLWHTNTNLQYVHTVYIYIFIYFLYKIVNDKIMNAAITVSRIVIKTM